MEVLIESVSLLLLLTSKLSLTENSIHVYLSEVILWLIFGMVSAFLDIECSFPFLDVNQSALKLTASFPP